METVINKHGLCGLWVSPEGEVFVSFADADGRRIERKADFRPFVWIEDFPEEGVDIQKLVGKGQLNHTIHFNSVEEQKSFLKEFSSQGLIESVKPLESQWLLQHQMRLFEGIHFDALRRCQCDIETHSSVENSFCNAKRAGDRVLAIGLKCGGQSKYLVLEAFTDSAERKLLEEFSKTLQDMDPDTIEGHNFFKFDLQYLKLRCQRLGLPCNWGRFGGQEAQFRNTRFKVAERWVDFPRCDIPGRTVFDTYLMVQLYDVTKREMPSYGLKAVARYLGITDKVKDNRTYLNGHEIQNAFESDRATFLAYLEDDLREIKGVADLLLPTYVAQIQNFPMSLQEASLRGTANKVDLIFLEKYYHAKHSLPVPKKIGRFAGGFTKSYEEGVFKKVLHFDVASLYPSLLMLLDRNPSGDNLGCFMPMLKQLREYRLDYKKKAKEAIDEGLRQEYEARQQSFKILINSFYGYLGFDSARFSDGALAAEVTAKGRELLQNLIEEFQRLGCKVLEADTDGLYVHCPDYFDAPNKLLDKVLHIMPKGIDLEYDGSYEAMFSYKAKNYALLEGGKVIIRGSALRSRGMEPFLKELTDCLIYSLLGVEGYDVETHLKEIRTSIESGKMPIERLARTETLSQKPEVYAKAVQEPGKSRRASLEVALKMDPIPAMGDKVTYFIKVGEKARMPDWQVACPISEKAPYDPKYYLRKLDEWVKRYDSFIKGDAPDQLELL